MEVDGVKRVLSEIIIPAAVIALWLSVCYPVCRREAGFDWFLYWILVGCPFGIRRMCLWLIPKNFGIGGSMGILALNCIVGGLIGGVVIIVRMLGIAAEIVKMTAAHFWRKRLKAERRIEQWNQ